MLLFNAQLTEINQAWWRMQPTNATSGGCSPPFEKWSMTSKHHSFVCLLQTVFQVTAPPSDKPLSIFKAPVSWIDQPCGPSNFTTHLWGHGEALLPAESVYVTESTERKSIPSHLDRLNLNIIATLFALSSPSFLCMILHNNTASRVR